jgi:Family of unknown function (DUF6540)
MVTVEVILYKAEEQEFRHWALHFEGPGRNQHAVYQVMGESGTFVYDKTELRKEPSKSKRYCFAVHVSHALDHLNEAEEVLMAVAIDNEHPNWNCQDWVIAALEALKDEELIPEYDYYEALEQLNLFIGPNDESDD